MRSPIGPRMKNGLFYKNNVRVGLKPKRQVVPTKALTTVVNKLIKKQQETKYTVSFPFVTPSTVFNSQITGTNEIYTCIPALSNGNLPNQRIGDKVSPVKTEVRLNLSFSSGDNAARDITAHVFMLRSKSVKCVRNSTNVPITNLLDIGSASALFDGSIERAQFPVQKENFTVIHHRKVRLQKVNQTPGSVGSQNANTSKDMVLRFKCGQLKYDGTLDIQNPQNDYVFLAIAYTYNCGDQAPDTFSGCLTAVATSHMWYKDA